MGSQKKKCQTEKTIKKKRKWKRAYAITEIRETKRDKIDITVEKPLPVSQLQQNLIDSWETFSHIHFLAITKMHSWYFPPRL